MYHIRPNCLLISAVFTDSSLENHAQPTCSPADAKASQQMVSVKCGTAFFSPAAEKENLGICPRQLALARRSSAGSAPSFTLPKPPQFSISSQASGINRVSGGVLLELRPQLSFFWANNGSCRKEGPGEGINRFHCAILTTCSYRSLPIFSGNFVLESRGKIIASVRRQYSAKLFSPGTVRGPDSPLDHRHSIILLSSKPAPTARRTRPQ